MTTKRKIMSVLVVISLGLSIGWIYLTKEVEISGDRFKSLVLESDKYMYSSWYLYFEDQKNTACVILAPLCRSITVSLRVIWRFEIPRVQKLQRLALLALMSLCLKRIGARVWQKRNSRTVLRTSPTSYWSPNYTE